ncbi:NTE family protein [Scopulibacillus darangshiensis]|uniref:NTE family protein n=1 Tax=Scopulibacillus darangshiensis TaxID=442528 RepID=A0A4R2P8K3_9BACL|nr:patatin-like phospholipase family protein [Scopulibacillus darangshiensis]TCP31167.1 NTE family protein [Scopulibacillus darangshiensis]
MWIDGVFSGGGVKAFAFVGALEVLDKAGFRFRRLAGTSAGSIVAGLLAAGYTSKEIHKHMEAMQPSIFLDQQKSLFKLPFLKWLTLYWRMGLYRGNVFEKWMRDLLRAKGVDAFGDLPPDTLKIIVSDISRGKMVVLPDDLTHYGIDPAKFSVARAVRMSCSLPFFFEPVPLYNQRGEKCLIVDGGVLSNFPLWLFDKGDTLPVRPFLGFQLSGRSDMLVAKKIKNAVDLFQGLFSTMREAHDAKYISKYAASNIIFIPVDDVQTSDFKLSDKDRDKLVDIGKKRAEQFLKKWTY